MTFAEFERRIDRGWKVTKSNHVLQQVFIFYVGLGWPL